MNTLIVKLTEQQYDLLHELIGYGMDRLDQLISTAVDQDHLEQFMTERSGAGQVADTMSQSKTYLWGFRCGRLQLEIPVVVVDEVAVPGAHASGLAAEAAIAKHGYLRKQLERLDNDAALDYLASCAVKVDCIMTRAALDETLLWSACWELHTQGGARLEPLAS